VFNQSNIIEYPRALRATPPPCRAQKAGGPEPQEPAANPGDQGTRRPEEVSLVVRFVALSERTKLSPLLCHSFEAQILNLGALGLHFGTLGHHFGVILGVLAPLGAHFGHFVGIYQKRSHFPARLESILAPFLEPWGTKVATKPQKVTQKWVSGRGLEKNKKVELPTASGEAPYAIRTVITICFVRFARTLWGRFWRLLGSFWAHCGSLRDPLGHSFCHK